MDATLTHLNLSDNSLKDDVTVNIMRRLGGRELKTEFTIGEKVDIRDIYIDEELNKKNWILLLGALPCQIFRQQEQSQQQ